MNKVRVIISYLVVSLAFMSCLDNKSHLDNAESIITKSIEVSGGDRIENSIISFNFRDKAYKATRNDGLFILERSFQDSTRIVSDRLSNSGFTRYVNGKKQKIEDSIAAKYSSSVNSVHYFSILPYGLTDPAVNYKYLGKSTLSGIEYHKIMITFDEVGGGEDFEDIFVYWFDTETYKLDYLAYSFHVNGGGLRFRKAFNERYINGIRVVDYENFKPKNKQSKLVDLDLLFEKNELELLSKIELKNVEVAVIDK